jgi:hypothetical protein
MNKGYNFSFPSPKNCGSFLKKMSLGGAWVGARPAQAVRSQALFARGFASRRSE